MARRLTIASPPIPALGRLLPFPDFALSIPVFVGVEFEDAGDGVEARQLRGCGVIEDRAAVADGSSLLETADARTLPRDLLALEGHHHAFAFSVHGPVGPD